MMTENEKVFAQIRGTQRNLTTEEVFAQAARCGHIDGKARGTLYVKDEEVQIARESAVSNTHDSVGQESWYAGYSHGYRLGVQGKPLEGNLR